MRLLFDENFEQSIVEHFRATGHDVVSVGSEETGVADTTILARARRDRRIIVTNDLDFGSLIYHRGLAPAGIILLRVRSLPVHQKIALLKRVVTRWKDDLPRSFTVITERRVRIRPFQRLATLPRRKQ